jgi:hypothetical protein
LLGRAQCPNIRIFGQILGINGATFPPRGADVVDFHAGRPRRKDGPRIPKGLIIGVRIHDKEQWGITTRPAFMARRLWPKVIGGRHVFLFRRKDMQVLYQYRHYDATVWANLREEVGGTSMAAHTLGI